MRLVDKGYDCYPVSGGIVFLTRAGKGRTYVFFDGSSLHEIDKRRYWRAVLGEVTDRILAQATHDWDDYGVSVSKNKAEYVAACLFEDDTISIFDEQGELQSEFRAETDFGINGIAWADDGIWCAAAADMTVDLYCPSGTLLRTLGAPHDANELSYPEHVAVRSGMLYVSDMGHHRVACCKAEEASGIETYRFFGEPVWEWHFSESLGKEIVRLNSGIYLLDDEKMVAA